MEFKTSGVCAKVINFEVEDGVLTEISFQGGCNGNLSGISSLLIGMKVEDVIKKLEGTTCGPRDTSCPDQVTVALKHYLDEQAKQA